MSFKIIGLGEALWDLLPSGPQLGGAPANFAYHARMLGGRAEVITRVGKDLHGEEIKRRFTGMGLSTEWVQVDENAPTGTVTVTLSGKGIPEYTIHENVAWDHIAATPGALALARDADAICFGSLAQRNPAARESIQRLVGETTPAALRILDINLRQSFFDVKILETSLALANVLKLNETELPVLTRLFGGRGDVRGQVEFLADQHELRVVALTRGAEGSLIYRDGEWSECPSLRVEVKDTVGAGDSFTAALCLGLLGGMELEAINAAATAVASYVCGCAGATPTLPGELRRLFTPGAGAVLADKPVADVIPELS